MLNGICSLVQVGNYKYFCLEQIQVILLILQCRRRLYNRPFDLCKNRRPFKPDTLFLGHNVIVQGHKALVGTNDFFPIIFVRVIEQCDILYGAVLDIDLEYIIVMEIQDFELNKINK